MPRRQENPQFKTTLYPVKLPDDLENWATWQTVCVPVPVPLIEFIPDILRPYRWQERWIGTEAQKKLCSEIWEDLINRFIIANSCAETGAAMILRQNPANACQLQQSVDGGVSWTLAFDYSLCRSPILNYQLEIDINQQFQQWSETTTNTEINNFAPTLTFTSSAGETEARKDARELALCYAVKLYVDAYCEAIRQINADATALANLVNLGLGVAAAVGAIATAATGGATLPLYLGLAAALGSAGVGAYSTLTTGVLNDTGARQSLACLMYNTLKDLEPTAENFALAASGGTLTGNAELIRATLVVDLGNEAGLENQFNAFINLLGEQVRPAELGLINDCPCKTWEYEVNPSDLPPGYTSFVGTPTGDHWRAADLDAIHDGVAFAIDWTTLATITGFSLSMRNGTGITASGVVNRFFTYTTGANGGGSIVGGGDLPIQDADWDVDVDFAPITARSLNVQHIFETCDFELFRCKIRGTGFNPFL